MSATIAGQFTASVVLNKLIHVHQEIKMVPMFICDNRDVEHDGAHSVEFLCISPCPERGALESLRSSGVTNNNLQTDDLLGMTLHSFAHFTYQRTTGETVFHNFVCELF